MDQPPDPSGYSFSSQIDYEYPFDSGVVDDIVVPYGSHWVSRIEWWGVYWNYPVHPGSVDGWVITFYEDDGNCRPGAAYVIPMVLDFDETNDEDTDIYAYSAHITPVTLTTGHYWLEIQAVMVFHDEGQWGWKTSLIEEGECGAPLQGFPLIGLPYWTAQTEYTGMAFRLYQELVATEDATFSSIKSLY